MPQIFELTLLETGCIDSNALGFPFPVSPIFTCINDGVSLKTICSSECPEKRNNTRLNLRCTDMIPSTLMQQVLEPMDVLYSPVSTIKSVSKSTAQVCVERK